MVDIYQARAVFFNQRRAYLGVELLGILVLRRCMPRITLQVAPLMKDQQAWQPGLFYVIRLPKTWSVLRENLHAADQLRTLPLL